jgi:hypothetical protein
MNDFFDGAESSRSLQLRKLTHVFWDVYDACMNFLDHIEDDLHLSERRKSAPYDSSLQQLRELLLRSKSVVLDFRRNSDDEEESLKAIQIRKLQNLGESYKSKLIDSENRLGMAHESNLILQSRLSVATTSQVESVSNQSIWMASDSNVVLPAITSSRGHKTKKESNDSNPVRSYHQFISQQLYNLTFSLS